MLYNKYGIIIKKKLKEKYNSKYMELVEQKKINKIIATKQVDITNYKKELLKKIKKPLFKERVILIENKVFEKIEVIVNEIGKNKLS